MEKGKPTQILGTGCCTMGRNRIPAKKKDRRKIYVYPSGRAYGRDHFDFQRFRMIRIPSSAISSSAANPGGIIRYHPLSVFG